MLHELGRACFLGDLYYYCNIVPGASCTDHPAQHFVTALVLVDDTYESTVNTYQVQYE